MSSKDPPKIIIELTELEAKSLLKLITWFFAMRRTTRMPAQIRQHAVVAISRVNAKLNERL